MQPIFVAFFTRDTIYEQEAARLRTSLLRHGIEHYLEGVPDAGSWRANTHKTAGFMARMLERYDGRPVVYLDCDAFIWKFPEVLFNLSPEGTDIAFHRRRGVELMNGTVWLANNKASRAVVARYAELCEQNPQHRDEQSFLWKAVEELKPRYFLLDASLCWVHDVMSLDLGDAEPVIEQMQCSRESSKSSLLPNRRARLAYLSTLGF